jgi:hypothetical protein
MKFPLRIVLAGMVLLLFSEMPLAVSVKASASCGVWVTEREKEKGAEKLGSLFNRRWLIGYLSGLASGRNKEFWDIPNASPLDYEAVFLWMDDYCRANPQKDIADGAARLFNERTRSK